MILVENLKEMESLWYESEDGDKISPSDDPEFFYHAEKYQKEYKYQRTRFPNQVQENMYNFSDGKCTRVFSGTSSYFTDLVLAMVRPSLIERLRSFLRTGKVLPLKDFNQAVLIAAFSCERCTNVLMYEYGLKDGYKLFSDEWKECSTCCEHCQELKIPERAS